MRKEKLTALISIVNVHKSTLLPKVPHSGGRGMVTTVTAIVVTHRKEAVRPEGVDAVDPKGRAVLECDDGVIHLRSMC